MVPWAATVYGMVVDSQALLNDSAVISDEHTLDLQIAQYMNDFQVCEMSIIRSFHKDFSDLLMS